MRACGLYNKGFLIYSTIRGEPCASPSRNFFSGRTIVRDNRGTHVGRTIRIPDLYNNKKDPCASHQRIHPCASHQRIHVLHHQGFFMCEKVSLIGKNYDWEILRGKIIVGRTYQGLGSYYRGPQPM